MKNFLKNWIWLPIKMLGVFIGVFLGTILFFTAITFPMWWGSLIIEQWQFTGQKAFWLIAVPSFIWFAVIAQQWREDK